jgi:hypothetical protein
MVELGDIDLAGRRDGKTGRAQEVTREQGDVPAEQADPIDLAARTQARALGAAGNHSPRQPRLM